VLVYPRWYDRYYTPGSVAAQPEAFPTPRRNARIPLGFREESRQGQSKKVGYERGSFQGLTEPTGIALNPGRQAEINTEAIAQSPSFDGSSHSRSSRLTATESRRSTAATSWCAMPVHVNRLRALCAPIRESRLRN